MKKYEINSFYFFFRKLVQYFFPCMVLCDETLGIHIQHVLSLRALLVGWGYVLAWNFGGDYREGQA